MQGNGKVAVIDIGSNTIKALCVEDRDGRLHKLGAQSIEARLGGEQRDGRPWLTDERREAAVDAIRKLVDFVQAYDPDSVEAVATSAVRDAENQEQFRADIKRATGLTLRVLSEAQEAMLIGRGISCDPGLPDRNSFAAVDLGGGSLQLTQVKQGEITSVASFPLGAVRTTTRFCPHDPPEPGEICALRTEIRTQLAPALPPARTGRIGRNRSDTSPHAQSQTAWESSVKTGLSICPSSAPLRTGPFL